MVSVAAIQTDNSDLISIQTEGTKDSTQYLTFIMAEEEYGIEILSVQEIRGWDSATPLPKAPPHVKGVINLRGIIVPIVDMRLCFELPAIKYTPLSVVIVLKIEIAGESRTAGIVVDAISDVYTISHSDIKNAPHIGAGIDITYIQGFADVNGSMVTLLEMDQLLNLEALPDLSDMDGSESSVEPNEHI